MELYILAPTFSICKITDTKDIPIMDEFCFLAKSDEEISLVCDSSHIPPHPIQCEHGWKGFRIQGELAFSMVGILSKITTLLANQNISIFAISTYNTDYLFIKEAQFNTALTCLANAGYSIGWQRS